jgi:UDP-N-acetyl-2-amino-2-deoxyglucuronate dehydrogenase
MAEPVRFALVGLGYGATRCAMFESTPGAELVAVADRDEARAKEYGERYGAAWYPSHTALLDRDDIDVVGIYTPSGLHRDIAIDVARSGKHVLVTKPIEVSLDRADAIIDACGQADVQLFCEFYSRYFPDNYRMHQAIQHGDLGRLILGEFSFKCYRPDAYYASDGAWRATWELNGGGVVMNQTIHAIDKLSWCMGEVASVQALTGTFAHDVDVEDTAAALLRLRSGAIATLVGTSTFRTTSGFDDMYGGGFTSRSEVNGDLGSLTVVDDELAMEKLEGGPLRDDPGRPVNVFDDIARAVRDRDYSSPTLARAADARKAVEIAMAIYQSARTGAAVPLAAPAA